MRDIVVPQLRAADHRQCLSSDNSHFSFYFIQPAGLQVEQLLPHNLLLNADEARWIVHCLISKQIRRRVDQDGFARLHSKVLEQNIAKKKVVPIFQALQSAGVIEIDPSYRVGKYSKGYRIAEPYMCTRPVRVRATSPRLLERLNKNCNWRARIQWQRRKPIHDVLDEIQRQHLTIDTKRASHVIETELRPSVRLVQLALAGNLAERRIHGSVSSTGRYFNSLTGVSRRVRPTLRLAGLPLAAVDLTCCQPALIALLWHLLATKGWKGSGTYKLPLSSADELRLTSLLTHDASAFEHYKEIVCVGRFMRDLTHLVSSSTGKDISLQTVKRRFFVDVLAPKHRYPSSVRATFETNFPTVATFIQAVNRDDYRALIRLLQRLEAWFVVETVAPRLVTRIPVVTLHDAIYCRDLELDLALVELTFREVFDELGFSIAMKRERYALAEPPDVK